jgi:4-hydroxyphenylpyruvate dioxygenase
MEIDHIHFYVEDAPSWRDWCCYTLGFAHQGSWQSPHTQTELLVQGNVNFICSSALTSASPVATYLKNHPPGVADLALRVVNLSQCLQQAQASGAHLTLLPQRHTWPGGQAEFAQIQGWGNLRHTLVQRQGETGILPEHTASEQPLAGSYHLFNQIDHAVLNVEAINFDRVVSWYESVLGFKRQQRFEIQTSRSGLCSQVLVHPQGGAQLPVNAPTGKTSQIQEFLDWNRGSGIQHLALHTYDLVQTTQQLRQRGLAFLSTPSCYYTQLNQALKNFPNLDLAVLAKEQILVDWQVKPTGSLLLQIFSQPIFNQPTFFLEFIERRQQAQGFGEGNFLALFTAIEREQLQRAASTSPAS